MRQVALILSRGTSTRGDGSIEALGEPLDTIWTRTPARVALDVYFAVEYDPEDYGRRFAVSFQIRDLVVAGGDWERIAPIEAPLVLSARGRAGMSIPGVPVTLGNPGTYEFAVLLDGEPAASASFMVLPDPTE